MSTARVANNEALILQRAIEPKKATLSAAAARSILSIEFSALDKARMRALAASARAGTLSAEEQREIDIYGRVGSLLAILKAKARKSLKEQNRNNGSAN